MHKTLENRKLIKSYNLPELEDIVREWNYERFRADQIYHSIFSSRINSFDSMDVLPVDIRQELNEKYSLPAFANHSQRHSEDGSVKFLFELHDGNFIETVYMPWFDSASEKLIRSTLCISSMAGCPLGCSFCATGMMGFKRNLACAEIVDQVLEVERLLNVKIDNIVFMGMGEPLLNYKNVIKAMEILTDDKIKLIGRKKITLSTIGIIPRIKQLAIEMRPVKLALSLHATTDNVRNKIIPITKSFPIDRLIESMEYYYRTTKISVTFEYILFDGLNDSDSDARRLARFSKRLPSKINIIPFNDISFSFPEDFSSELKPSPATRVENFIGTLRDNSAVVIVRDSFGKDIEAACGQLALSALNSQEFPD